jgi:hypothetical protein
VSLNAHESQVDGSLNPHQKGFKDLGYYIAEGHEGFITPMSSAR